MIKMLDLFTQRTIDRHQVLTRLGLSGVLFWSLSLPLCQAAMAVDSQTADAMALYKEGSHLLKAQDLAHSFVGLVKQAFDDWAKAAAGAISFQYVNSPEKSDISCTWSNHRAAWLSEAEGGQAADAFDTNSITRADMMLLPICRGTDEALSNNRMRRVVLHEIGHALGLSGQSSDPGDIMFGSISDAEINPVLSARDCRTIAKLYSQDTKQDQDLLKAIAMNSVGINFLKQPKTEEALAGFSRCGGPL